MPHFRYLDLHCLQMLLLRAPNINGLKVNGYIFCFRGSNSATFSFASIVQGKKFFLLTLLHLERPKLHIVSAVPSAIGLRANSFFYKLTPFRKGYNIIFWRNKGNLPQIILASHLICINAGQHTKKIILNQLVHTWIILGQFHITFKSSLHGLSHKLSHIP